MRESKLEKLLETETEHLKKLNQIVFDAVEEEKLLSQKLFDFEETHPSFADRLADKVALFGGSWKFVLSFLLLMVCWVSINVYLLTYAFDPFPFILLNLVLSTIAALQAPLIMMSQNRKENRDRQRSINDYMINMKAEIEVRNLHRKLDLLMAEQMQTLFDLQDEQVQLMRDIRDRIGSADSDGAVLEVDDPDQANP